MDQDSDMHSCMINEDSVCLEVLSSDSGKFFKMQRWNLQHFVFTSEKI